jgi:hypothetical protein
MVKMPTWIINTDCQRVTYGTAARLQSSSSTASSNMFKPAALGLSSTALVCLAKILVCWKPKLVTGQRIQEQLGVDI